MEPSPPSKCHWVDGIICMTISSTNIFMCYPTTHLFRRRNIVHNQEPEHSFSFRYIVFTTWLLNVFDPFCSDRKLQTLSQSQFSNNAMSSKLGPLWKKIFFYKLEVTFSPKFLQKFVDNLIFLMLSFCEGNRAFLRS